MDLKIKDVTELLNVSESTIKRWISDGKIPYYRMNNQYRFSPNEIESWMLSARQTDLPLFDDKETIGTQQYGLFRAIHKGEVYSTIKGKDKEEVIRSCMQQIAAQLHLDAEVITELLLDRENLMSTALSNGIAVPHTRDFLLQESYDVITVVFLNEPIEYGALDKEPVHTLFFLFACDDKRHLHLLAKLAHLCSKKENLSFLKKKPEKLPLLQWIKNWEMQPSLRS